VAGIVAALITDHDVETIRKQIDYLALALVSPLRAEDDNVTHFAPNPFIVPWALERSDFETR